MWNRAVWMLLLTWGAASQTPEPVSLPATEITVTATRGAEELVTETPQVAISVERDRFVESPTPTLGHVLAQEPGVLLQQTTAGQVSPFLRGLTGYQVLNLIDGVRFNNSTFRSGPNQYLVFVEPAQARRVEALLGPSGSQYGSDSLGGVINIITPEARYGSGGALATHGELGLFGATADASGMANAQLSIGTERFSWLFGGGGRRLNDVRAGGGLDSRNVFHRLFGMPTDQVRDVLGGRQQDTGFTQYGAHTRFDARVASEQTLSVWYQRGGLYGVRGYKDLLGGLGRVQSGFEPQTLDFLYARYEKQRVGRLDSLSGTFSLNSQGDGSVRQNLRDSDPITRDRVRVNAFGYSAQGAARAWDRVAVVFGGDIYDERIGAARTVTAPPTGVAQASRPLYPDSSVYRTFGLFGQSMTDLVANRLRLGLGGRLTRVSFRNPANALFGVASSDQAFRDATFNASLAWDFSRRFGVNFLAGRGFRAPNLNDLGAIGINDLGYEIPAAESIPAGGLLSDSAGEGALSKGRTLEALKPESLFNYEFGLRFTADRLYARVQVFDAELSDPIVRRTVLFPAGAAPSQLAGLPVTVIPPTAAQQAQGVVAVATQLDPRAVKAFVNDGRARYSGVESLLRYAISARWHFRANYTFLAGRDLDPNRNIRRLPPQMGFVSLRYTPPGRRYWVEGSMHAAGAQRRLSGGDLDDERIGASRRRSDIAAFFQGARVQPYLDSEGRFTPTGETLREIQDRLLALGAVVNGVRVADDNTRVPLYLSTAGWVSLNVNAGLPLTERLSVLMALTNIADRNYRFHGSGIDAPGVNAYAGFRFIF